MATLNASKSGRLARTGAGSHTVARDATTANSTSVNPTFSTSNGIQYSRTAGRRGNSYNIYRVFYYFDTSGITGTVSAASLNITGFNATTADVIVVPSTAFSGDGSTNIVAGDFDNLSFNTNYSAEFTGWSTGLNTLTLKPQARTDIQNNDYFICAVIQYDNDYLDTDPGSNVTRQAGVAFGTAAYLDYTEASSGPTNVAQFAGVAKANISKLSAVTFGDISKINGVD
jgi:hypothetical protein